MLEKYFLPLALGLSGLALAQPALFIPLKAAIPYLLGVIMFGMGLTLQWEDFKRVWTLRKLVAAGLLAQYTLMPLLGLGIGTLLGLPNELLVGLLVVGSCPGGTASNVIAYLAGANVALSITLTLASTALAPLLTPLLIHTLAGEMVTVAPLAMMKSVFWIVVFPLVDGLLLRHLLKHRLRPLLSVFPSISIAAVSVVIGIVMALNHQAVLQFPLLVIAAVILHNLAGLGAGYGLGMLFQCSPEDRRTLAIEIGMQNSGLGASLATTFLTPLSALPSALFSLWHNLSGIGLVHWWSPPSRSQNPLPTPPSP